jgi:hypothetical protein
MKKEGIIIVLFLCLILLPFATAQAAPMRGANEARQWGATWDSSYHDGRPDLLQTDESQDWWEIIRSFAEERRNHEVKLGNRINWDEHDHGRADDHLEDRLRDWCPPGIKFGYFKEHWKPGFRHHDHNGGCNPVPEPTSLLLLASGVVGLLGFRKRSKG